MLSPATSQLVTGGVLHQASYWQVELCIKSVIDRWNPASSQLLTGGTLHQVSYWQMELCIKSAIVRGTSASSQLLTYGTLHQVSYWQVEPCIRSQVGQVANLYFTYCVYPAEYWRLLSEAFSQSSDIWVILNIWRIPVPLNILPYIIQSFSQNICKNRSTKMEFIDKITVVDILRIMWWGDKGLKPQDVE